MVTAIRAVYENGHLRLLDPVDLAEGQQIAVQILSRREQLIALLGDRVASTAEDEGDELDEETLMREIEEGTRGVTLSDAIIEERREGP